MPDVLVTGASGYIGCHVVKQLLEKGYNVRGTVRNLKNEKECRPLKQLCPQATENLELVEADLFDAESWKRAVIDCKFVIHMASPCPVDQPRDADKLIKPAVTGTMSVLRACSSSKCVKRVVLTSSLGAVVAGHYDETLTEEMWADLNWKNISPYEKSKTLAEKAAWDYVNSLQDDEKFELVTVIPAHVQGPMLHETECLSMEVIKHFLEDKVPMVPNLGVALVDVRDAALAHIKAMEMPQLAGTRNIVFTRTIWFKEIVKILQAEFGPQGYHFVTKMAPYPLVWLKALFDRRVQQILHLWGVEFKVDNSRMTKVMGIDSPRDVETSILEMAHSIIEKGLIQIPKRVKKRQKRAF